MTFDLPLVSFYLFGTITVLAALAVISVKNPVHAALCLVLTFFSTACTWLLAEAEFLAIALVLVYVGAVMVLFLFVVMMLDINLVPLREGFVRAMPIGLDRRRRHAGRDADADRRPLDADSGAGRSCSGCRHVEYRVARRAHCSASSCCRSRSPR